MKTIKTLVSVFCLVFVLAFAATAQTSLPQLNGGPVDVQAQRGKVVILAVGASWLPLSAKQAEYTNMLAKRYAGKNVAVYFVLTDSMTKAKNITSPEKISLFVAENKLTIPVLRDSDGTATVKKFSIDQLPSFVIIGTDGKQVGSPFGGIDPKFDITVPISSAVDKLL